MISLTQKEDTEDRVVCVLQQKGPDTHRGHRVVCVLQQKGPDTHRGRRVVCVSLMKKFPSYVETELLPPELNSLFILVRNRS